MPSFQLTQDNRNSDLLGAAASGLCLIHCLATPLVFVAHAGVATHHGHGHGPEWWGIIDIVLLVVSLGAVIWAARNSSKQWMKVALAASWVFLALIILNEKLGILHLAEAWIYLPTVGLIGLHLYNRKYCQCEDEACEVP